MHFLRQKSHLRHFKASKSNSWIFLRPHRHPVLIRLGIPWVLVTFIFIYFLHWCQESKQIVGRRRREASMYYFSFKTAKKRGVWWVNFKKRKITADLLGAGGDKNSFQTADWMELTNGPRWRPHGSSAARSYLSSRNFCRPSCFGPVRRGFRAAWTDRALGQWQHLARTLPLVSVPTVPG